MNAKMLLARCSIAALLLTSASSVWAYPQFARETKMSCATCHTDVAGGPALTDAGTAYKADSTKVPATSVAGASYVGSQKCKMCHLKEHKSWQTTPHAGTLDSLRLASPEAVAAFAKQIGVKAAGVASDNSTCLGCHTTGFGVAGGYPPADDVHKATGADSTRIVALGSVGCESCHGPGSMHLSAEKAVKKTVINSAISAATCRGCHTASASPHFDYDKYKAKGVHEVKAATP